MPDQNPKPNAGPSGPEIDVARDPQGKVLSSVEIIPPGKQPSQKEMFEEAIRRLKAQQTAQRSPAKTGDGPVKFGDERYGTALTDNYLPTFAINPVLTVITPGSGGVTFTAQGIESYTPPPREYLSHTDTTLTGTNAGKQLVTGTVEKASQVAFTQIYGTKHKAALDAVMGINGCAISLTLIDGSIYAGIGVITKGAESQQSENNSLKTDVMVMLNAGFSYTVGSTGTTNA